VCYSECVRHGLPDLKQLEVDMDTLEQIKILGEQDQYPATVYRYCNVSPSMFGGHNKEVWWVVTTFEWNRYRQEVQKKLLAYKTKKEAIKNFPYAVHTENKCNCKGIKHRSCCNQK
jgi:hypothetical protein